MLCLCVCSHRTGVWLSDAKASVHMWRQQQSPRACWEDTKHLVPTTGERPEGPVWGMVANCNHWSWAGVFDFYFLHLTFSFAAYQIFCALEVNWKGTIPNFLPKAQHAATKEGFFKIIMRSRTENKRLIHFYCYVNVKSEWTAQFAPLRHFVL